MSGMCIENLQLPAAFDERRMQGWRNGVLFEAPRSLRG